MPTTFLPARPKPVVVPQGLTDGRVIVAHSVREHRGAPDDEIVESLARCAATISETAGRIATGNNNVMGDATQTSATNLKRCRDLTKKLLESAEKRIDEIYSASMKTVETLERSTQPPVPKDAMAAIYAGQVRDVLRSMSPADRMKTLRASLDDHQLIGAAVTGNPLLAGLAPNERDLILSMWRQRHHAHVLDRIEMIRKARSAIWRMSVLLSKWGRGLHADKAADIAAAERSHALAQEAMREAAE